MRRRIMTAAAALCVLITSCGIPNAKNTAADAVDFSGEWSEEADGAVVIDIWSEAEGVWSGEISRVDGDDTVSFWSFTGTAAGNTLKYSDMSRVVGKYDNEGEVTEETVYEGGSGSIILKKDKLSWKDDIEDAGKGMTFIYSGEY